MYDQDHSTFIFYFMLKLISVLTALRIQGPIQLERFRLRFYWFKMKILAVQTFQKFKGYLLNFIVFAENFGFLCG